MGTSTEAEVLIGIAEIAVALAGFSGVVVVFGSRSQGGWHPGDRLRLAFLLESSFTAGMIALVALVLLSLAPEERVALACASAAWAIAMIVSLVSSSRRLRTARTTHADVDDSANRMMFVAFAILIFVQIANALVWTSFAPLLAGLLMNLMGSCTQFGRLIRSAFRE